MSSAKAYYIKLGRGGRWEADSIEHARLRFGWTGQTLEDINSGRWTVIEEQLRSESKGKPGVATTDFNRLRDIAASTCEDLWVTFHQGKLWWTHLLPSPIEADSESKFRCTRPWSDRALTGRQLFANELPGRIAQLQAFRGTVCAVSDSALLRRVIEGTRSPLAMQISVARSSLSKALATAIAELHWKDFETLTDLVFRDAGWVRISVLGQQAKAFDLELREPVTGDKYVVQVKSQATLADLDETLRNFAPGDYRRIFFVVHSPAESLLAATGIPAHVELVLVERLAELSLNAGLAQWIEDKIA